MFDDFFLADAWSNRLPSDLPEKIISLSILMRKKPVLTDMIGGVNSVAAVSGPFLGGR